MECEVCKVLQVCCVIYSFYVYCKDSLHAVWKFFFYAKFMQYNISSCNVKIIHALFVDWAVFFFLILC